MTKNWPINNDATLEKISPQWDGSQGELFFRIKFTNAGEIIFKVACLFVSEVTKRVPA